MTNLPVSKERVLSTLNEDGSRLRIRPKLYQGDVLKKRRILAWVLMATFVLAPFIRIAGKPMIFLDVASRQFTFFGRTFFATDGVLLMLLMLSIFIGIIWLTALVGRGWCGWGCPQTVYMEFLFRPIERFFEGDRSAQLKIDKKGGSVRRVMKNVVFAFVSLMLANVFLAYFVGVETLGNWMLSPPSEHLGGFGVMASTAGLVFFNFAYFREQMCTVICPYARLQSALLDRDSLIIGYDEKRGEPRTKGKPKKGAEPGSYGDCIDCNACVKTCPTGIDIREGLQLECIACGQCVDACNTIMPKLGRAPGLVRYASQRSLGEGVRRVLRPRVIIYTLLMLALLTALLLVGGSREGADVTVLRGIGAPFVLQEAGVQNQVRVKIENRHSDEESYEIELLFDKAGKQVSGFEIGATVIVPENPLTVPGMNRRTTSIFVLSPKAVFNEGKLPILVRVTEPDGTVQEVEYRLLGPAD